MRTFPSGVAALVVTAQDNAFRSTWRDEVRVAGDRYILYEYGTPNDELDFDRRFRIHAFETKLLSLNGPRHSA